MDEEGVSIIIPTFNSEKSILKTLDSVLKVVMNDMEKLECIIVDDLSNDSSMEMIQDFINTKGISKNFQLHKRKSKNKGGNVCRNEGVSYSTKTHLLFLDADDYLCSDFWKTKKDVILSKNNIDLFYYIIQVDFKDNKSKLWNSLEDENFFLERFLLLDSPWQTSSVIWNKQYFCKSGWFNEGLIRWQEWELYIRVLTKNPKMKKINLLKPDLIYNFGLSGSINRMGNQARQATEKVNTIFEVIRVLKNSGEFFDNRKSMILDLIHFNYCFIKDQSQLKQIDQKITEYKLTSLVNFKIKNWCYKHQRNPISSIFRKFNGLTVKNEHHPVKSKLFKLEIE
ncbi:MAG: glycosyltransferase family 2 protein [Nitrososphaeraceae archaeon]|nr:glycosyltransferase family 2 protein [Nitrososphaeraceae archaeon]